MNRMQVKSIINKIYIDNVYQWMNYVCALIKKCSYTQSAVENIIA